MIAPAKHWTRFPESAGKCHKNVMMNDFVKLVERSLSHSCSSLAQGAQEASEIFRGCVVSGQT